MLEFIVLILVLDRHGADRIHRAGHAALVSGSLCL